MNIGEKFILSKEHVSYINPERKNQSYCWRKTNLANINKYTIKI